jgi:hypothetical protein
VGNTTTTAYATGGLGTTNGSIGNILYAGGSGANGVSSFAGGGGSGAGYATNGVSATNNVGATAPEGGGNGGTGPTSGSLSGTAGSAPGGGGGGSRNSSGTVTAGASGGSGQIILTIQSITKADQSITFGALSNKTYGDASFALTATASSGLGVNYTSSDPSVASISGSTVTILKAGITTITAIQSGNDNYNAATAVTQTLTVGKNDQTITFNALSDKKTGDLPFTLGATASSGLAVTYESFDTTVATISGSTVAILKAGSTVITASQTGSNNYNAATAVTQTLTVTQSGTTFGSWSGSQNTEVTPALVYKYAFGAADKNSAEQQMTSSITSTTLSLTAVVRTDDPKLVVAPTSRSSLSGDWTTSDKTVNEQEAGDQNLNGLPLGPGLVRKVYSVARGSDSKRFLKLEARYTP